MGHTTVEDRLLIQELYNRFYWALNAGDEEGVLACYAPGAQIERGGVGDTIGPEGSAKAAKEYANDPVGATQQHHVTSMLIDPDKDGREDRRRVRIYFLVTAIENPPTTTIRWGCRAYDVVQRIDGEWLFAWRRIALNSQPES